MSEFVVRLQLLCLCAATGIPIDPRRRDVDHSSRDRGQATTEYALVMLGAAAIALLVITWATAGGGAGKIGRLFDKVIDAVLDKV
ncbi:MAG: DUF4244 domain-containing protein [Ilumatobacteraceae bacterium]